MVWWIRKVNISTENDRENKDAEGKDTLRMKRQLTFITGSALIVGRMIGSGIFVAPKGVLELTGSTGLSLVVWLVCGIMSMMSGLCYAELGTLIPKSGGGYMYLLEAYRQFGILGELPAFMMSLLFSFLSRPSSLALQGIGFSEYVVTPIYGDCPPPKVVKQIIGLLFVVTLTFVNCYSVKMTAKTQVLFTAIKMAAVLFIALAGVVYLGTGHTDNLKHPFDDTTTSVPMFAEAIYAGMWAYAGIAILNTATEEVINPSKTLPQCLIFSVSVVTTCYLLMNVAYSAVLSKQEILASDAIAVKFTENLIGRGASILVPIFIAISIVGTGNGRCFSSGRACFSAAREGHLMHFLSYIHVEALTPVPSLIFNGIISMAMIVFGSIGSLAKLIGLIGKAMDILIIGGLILMRWTKKDSPRPYKVPIIIPVVYVLWCLYLVVAPILKKPSLQYLFVFVLIAISVIIYFPLIKYKWKIPLTDHLTLIVQKVFKVAPSFKPK